MQSDWYLRGKSTHEDKELERLRAFEQFEFIADEPNSALHEICLLAKSLFAVAYAGVSLVGKQDVLLLTPEVDAPARMSRENSPCARTILGSEVLTIDQIDADPGFLQSQGLAPFENGFYAGAPLAAAPGVNVGVFSIFDRRPRAFSDADKAQLRSLGHLAMNELLRQRSLRDLHDRDVMLSQASRMARVGISDLNLRTGAARWSEQMYSIMDLPPGAAPLTPLEFLAHVAPRDQERAAHEIASLDKGEDPDIQPLEIVRPNGDSRWLKIITETQMEGGVASRVLGCFQDVTELHLSHAEVERLAFYDSLTGLPSRTLFNQKFLQAIQGARETGAKVGLIMLDVDHFKDINDTLGHDAGDSLLRSVAQLLTKAYRSTDTVARLGGDEFAVILPDIRTRGDLIRPTEMLMELLRRPVEHGGQVFTISASVGAAIYPSDDKDAGQLQKNADIALYQAKTEGRTG